MKKNLLVILAAGLMPVMMNAQPTIVQADFPTPGTLWVQFDDGRVGVHTLTAAGASQSWNYANAFVVDDTTVINFIAPSAVPNGWGTNFPNATAAVYSAIDTSAQFFKSTSNGFYTDGAYTGTTGSPISLIDLNPDQLLVPGNFTYNSTRSNTAVMIFDQPGPPNIRVKYYIVQNFLGDAWGSLVTPNGTYPSTLRIKETSFTVDSTFIDLLGLGNYTFVSTNGPSDTTITYNWCKNGPLGLLMSIDYDVATQQTTGASYTSLTPVGINEPVAETDATHVFPNPAADGYVNFTFDNQDAEVLHVYSVEGRLIRTERVSGISKLIMSTATMSKGMYLYETRGKNGEKLSSGKFAVQK